MFVWEEVWDVEDVFEKLCLLFGLDEEILIKVCE